MTKARREGGPGCVSPAEIRRDPGHVNMSTGKGVVARGIFISTETADKKEGTPQSSCRNSA